MAPIGDYFQVVHAHTPETAVLGLTTIIGTQVHTQWFSRKHLAKLLEAALAVDKRANVYIRITPLQRAPQYGRGTERAALGSSVLWCDYDSYINQLQGVQQLEALEHPPTLIVNSGNGLHAYWLLDQFYTDLDAIKARNKGIIEDLNDGKVEDIADSCYDLARVLRVPGTYNVKGERPLECTVFAYHPDRVYALADFSPANIDDVRSIDVWDSVTLPGDFLEGLRERDAKLYKRLFSSDTARKVDAPQKGDGSIDRSRNDAYIATRLLGLGYAPAQVLAVLMHPEWLAGAKYTQTKRYDYVVMTVQSALQTYNNSTDRYFIKAGFQAQKLADELSTQSAYIYTAEKLWRYIDGVYMPDGEEHIREQVIKRLGRRWNTKAAAETVQWVTDANRLDIDQVNKHTDYINCGNGMLHIASGQLVPHSPSYLSLSQVAAHYDPDADTTEVDKFVAAIIPEDTIPVFWEYAGSAFALGRYFPKAFVTLVGRKDSGKSKLLELLVLFYGGKPNVTTFSIQTLADNKFATAWLFGKFANICNDLDEAEAHNTGQLKALTGDDYLSGEEKFKGFIIFKNGARLWFSANHYPRVRNPDEAYFRRSVIIPCPNHFDRATADPDIVSKLATPRNFSAMLLRSYQGLLRLIEHNDLSESASIHDASSDYRFTADTVSGFLHACKFDPKFVITKQAFYQAYREVCLPAGRKPVSDDLFFKRVSDNLDRFGMTQSYDQVTKDGDRAWRYHGRKPPPTIQLHIPGLGIPETYN